MTNYILNGKNGTVAEFKKSSAKRRVPVENNKWKKCELSDPCDRPKWKGQGQATIIDQTKSNNKTTSFHPKGITAVSRLMHSRSGIPFCFQTRFSLTSKGYIDFISRRTLATRNAVLRARKRCVQEYKQKLLPRWCYCSWRYCFRSSRSWSCAPGLSPWLPLPKTPVSCGSSNSSPDWSQTWFAGTSDFALTTPRRQRDHGCGGFIPVHAYFAEWSWCSFSRWAAKTRPGVPTRPYVLTPSAATRTQQVEVEGWSDASRRNGGR